MKFKILLQGIFILLCFSSLAFSQSVEVREDSQASPGGTLMDALGFLSSGELQADELVLVDGGGQYGVDFYDFTVPIVIRAADGLENNKPQLRPRTRSAKNPDMWQLNNDLTLQGLVFDGTVMNSTELDSIRRIFRVTATEGGPNFEPDLTIINCDFRNIYLNGDPNNAPYDGKLVEFSEGASAGRVWIENSTFTNFGDEVFNAGNTHKAGQPAVTPAHKSAFSSFTIRNCTFNNIHGSAIKLNGDADSTTVDPPVLIENITFNDCQRRVIWTRDLSNETVRNIIISNAKKGHETFSGTDQLIYIERYGSSVAHVDTFNISGIDAEGDTVVINNDIPFGTSDAGTYTGARGSAVIDLLSIYNHDPMYVDAANGDFTLAAGSPLYTLGHDGGPIGDRNWATNPPEIRSQEVREDAQAAPGGTLMDALGFLAAGQLMVDELVLVDGGGQYGVDFYDFTVPIVIRAADGLEENKPQLRPLNRSAKDPDMWQLNNDLTLQGLIFDGTIINSTEMDSIRRIFRVTATEGGPNFEPDLTILDCDFRNIWKHGDPSDASGIDGKLVEFSEGASAGRVRIENSTFTNFGDEVFNAGNTHKAGQPAVTPAHKSAFSSFTMRNCTFNDIQGSAIKLNGDADSTTVDPVVLIENVTFYFCQRRAIWTRDLSNMTVRNIIIANPQKGHEVFSGTDVLIKAEREGTTIAFVDTFNIEGVKSDGDTVVINTPFDLTGGTYTGAVGTPTLFENTIFGVDPMFADAANGDFTLQPGSPVATLGHDGGPLGDRRWANLVVSVDDPKPEIPRTFHLEQNYPNPFNPSTSIRYTLERSGPVKLQVYNILGKLVETLVDTETPAGNYTVTWKPTGVATGVYFYRLEASGKSQVKKMMLLK